MKAICLLSGGLDSTLTARVMLDQGIDLAALNCVSVFCTCTPKTASCSAAATAVSQLGIPLKVVNTNEGFLRIVKNPKHGYGRNMNPCLDCRIMMFRGAAEYMREIGASFIVTGEVLGERPMSQRRHAMRLIEREAGVEGLIVRPLSARLLEPSIPETEGWIDREKLLAIEGRCRQPQIKLADDYGLKDYPCPAGGCLLTDRVFGLRIRDLLDHDGDLQLNDVLLLKTGRHFRLSPSAKAVVGRNEEENRRLEALVRPGDVTLAATDVNGPLAVVRGRADDEALRTAAQITVRYGQGRDLAEVSVTASTVDSGSARTFTVPPADEAILDGLRIGQGALRTPCRTSANCDDASEE